MNDSKRLQAELKDAVEHVATLEVDLADLERQQASLEREHSAARVARDENKRDTLSGRLVALERTILATSADLETARAEVARLERELEAAQQRETLAALEQAVQDARSAYQADFHGLLEHIRGAIPDLLGRFETWHVASARLHDARTRAGHTTSSNWNPRLASGLKRDDFVGFALVEALDETRHQQQQQFEAERRQEREVRTKRLEAERLAALERVEKQPGPPARSALTPRGSS